MKDYIVEFIEEFQYPVEAKETLLTAYEALEQNQEAWSKFYRDIELYYTDRLEEQSDYSPMLKNLEEAAVIVGVNPYTVHLLFMICLSKHLRKIYKERNISDEIFHDSMSDLKWKLFECHKMHGVWGNFVAFWDMGFFFLKLFALGRLQFELYDFHEEHYQRGEYKLNKGDKVVNIHIPSCGTLREEDCYASYKKAMDFFGEYFEGKVMPFVCHSWLLFPPNEIILSPSSNILTFMKHFDIIEEIIDEKGEDLWRVFYQDFAKPVEELPEDTSIQRTYKSWLMKGNKVGVGYGVFFFDGETIIKG